MRTRLTKSEEEETRADIRQILSLAPDEVVGVRDALVNGRINGGSYSGECRCLVGTIAKLRHISPESQMLIYPPEKAIPMNPSRPAEVFFANIFRGDTPDNSPYSKLALQWVDEWIDERAAMITVESQSYSLTT